MASSVDRTDLAPGVARPPTADELICDDGEPMETARHRDQMNLLVDSLDDHWAARQDVCVGGNMFLYFSLRQTKANDFRGPDVFVVLGTERRERKAWVVWEEGGRVPDVIIELTSETTAETDRGEKMRVYERVLRVPEYVLFDPWSAELEAYRLGEAGSGYAPIAANPAGRIGLRTLGLELGVWPGVFRGVEARWLRWYTPEGSLVPAAAELAARAKEHVARAEERATQAEERAAQAEARLAEYERRFGPLAGPASGG